MPVDTGERSVLAYFPSSSGAGKAAEELREIGYDIVHVERISHYGAGNEEAGGAAVGRMTMFSSEDDPAESINMGMTGAEGEKAFLVTVLTGEGNAGQVTGILEKHGGRI
ncbi:MAG: hypothetical protein ACOY4I_01790 [Bacillota bacterium]